MRNLHTGFHSGCTSLLSYQWYRIVPFFFMHPYWCLLFLVFLLIALLTDVRCYLIVILICISLMLNGVEHLLMSSWPSVMSRLERCLFISSAHSLIKLWGFVVGFFCSRVVWVPYKFCILALIIYIICKYFLPSVDLFLFLCQYCTVLIALALYYN